MSRELALPQIEQLLAENSYFCNLMVTLYQSDFFSSEKLQNIELQSGDTWISLLFQRAIELVEISQGSDEEQELKSLAVKHLEETLFAILGLIDMEYSIPKIATAIKNQLGPYLQGKIQ